ncbi:MAG: hypothetical protein JXN59_12190 [Anaerolineae bacterium]|nr:hypothetical protein [Anaerolineae bacterium]
MKVRVVRSGEIEIDGHRYDHDVIIRRGKVSRRRKKPSRIYRERFGHTPLSLAEDIPWNGKKLIVGTGTHGEMPIMSKVYKEAEKRGVKLIVVPTGQACALLDHMEDDEINAILHVAC